MNKTSFLSCAVVACFRFVSLFSLVSLPVFYCSCRLVFLWRFSFAFRRETARTALEARHQTHSFWMACSCAGKMGNFCVRLSAGRRETEGNERRERPASCQEAFKKGEFFSIYLFFFGRACGLSHREPTTPVVSNNYSRYLNSFDFSVPEATERLGLMKSMNIPAETAPT